MPALVALTAETRRATGGAAGGGFFREQLEKDQVAGVADAVVAELDDSGVAARAVAEFGGDVLEQPLDDLAMGAALVLDPLLIFIDQAPVAHQGDHTPARIEGVLPRQRDQLLCE